MRKPSLRSIVVIGLVLSALLGWSPAARHVRAVQLLQQLSGPAATAEQAPAIRTEAVLIPRKSGELRARLYFRADRKTGPGIVVAHGVHYRGIDEQRLVRF